MGHFGTKKFQKCLRARATGLPGHKFFHLSSFFWSFRAIFLPKIYEQIVNFLETQPNICSPNSVGAQRAQIFQAVKFPGSCNLQQLRLVKF